MPAALSRRAFARALPLLPFMTSAGWAHPLENRYGMSFGPRMCLDAQGRTPIAVAPDLRRVLVIAAGGQSNCSNTAGGRYAPQHPHLYNLNIGDALVYRAEEPLLGCDIAKEGASSNFLTRLGDAVLQADLADAVVLAPFAISGVPAWLWGKGGRFHRNVTTAASRIKRADLPTRAQVVCIWQHGETDNILATAACDYTRHVVSVADAIQGILGPVPFVTAQASLYHRVMSPEIRTAQAAVARTAAHRYVGPDTDAVDASGRHTADCTHWNADGARTVARLWLESLAPLV
jgi:hypothetical protein